MKEQFDRYLIIRRSEKQKSGYTINVREDVLAEELAHAGWLVPVSKHVAYAAEAIQIHRDKDVVEKGFPWIKRSLGLDRLRVHSQQAMESRVFIGFTSLILNSHLHRVTLEHKLYKTMTMKELIRTMEKLCAQVIDNRKILFPMTRRQRGIYQAFAVSPPV